MAMHIAYCFDKNYQPHFGASLTSLLLSSGLSGSDLQIHVVTDEVDQTFSEKLDRLRRVFNAKIKLYSSQTQGIQSFANLPIKSAKQSYLTQATWTRIQLANILPADVSRVLYLDSDTIVLSDLRKLFDSDMNGAPVAGVADFSEKEMCARFGLNSYINSGVLLMDLQQWRAKGYVAGCLEHGLRTRDENLYGDQCAINTFFAGNIHLLDKQWNRFVTSSGNANISDGTAILHFITADKPWRPGYQNSLAKYYWKYLDVSPWFGAETAPPQVADNAPRLTRQSLPPGKRILPELISAFRSVGYEPVTGYNSYHFDNWMDAPFTKFVFKGELVGTAGLALQEIMFLEGLGDLIEPRSILVIGNAHGWSSVALALIFPQARIVALDPNERGNAVTNQIAGLLGLNLVAIAGRSPEDVSRLFVNDFGPFVDFCLIDAIHDDEHLKADFLAIYPFLTRGSLIAMHDVINWNMMQGFQDALSRQGISGRILTRTASGMGIAWHGDVAEPLLRYIDAFTEPVALFQSYQTLIRQHRSTKAAVAIAGYRP